MKKIISLIGGLVLAVTGLQAQQIIIDRPVRAEELTVFPSVSQDHTYYYILDQASLAYENGKPQFSFLRYVSNSTGTDDSREGEGGGIVHALVSLEVTQEQIQDAERALRRVDPEGKIVGPVIYSRGRFALISSFAQPDGTLSTQVLGLGSAPILDGQKAAISIHLTKQGAKLLWESFKTPTPDISFSFEMELPGYRSPKNAVIEANFDQIYKHATFQAGIATPYIGAEIEAAFEELRRNGAITITQVGEDEQFNELIATAYNKVAEMMFEPINGSGSPSLSDITAMAGSGSSPLDRATALLAQNRNNHFQQVREEQAANRNSGEHNSGASSNSGGNTSDDSASSTTTEPEEAESPESGETTSSEGEGETASSEDADSEESTETPEEASEGDSNESETRRSSAPQFAAIVTFKMRRQKKSGTFKVNLNKYTIDQLPIRFDENIGDLRRFVDDSDHFHQVNLDDDFYRQRVITAFLDGYNATDFGTYINFVNIHLTKRHAEGAMTEADIRIDRNNFNQQGNNFQMVYGWKEDRDRTKWMEYQYEVNWSFFGGHEIVQPIQTNTFSAINLKPPLERRTLTFESDPDYLKDQGVRAIQVTIYYTVGETEQIKQVSLNTFRNEYSKTLDILLPEGVYDYDYEIVWRKRGNGSISSGRLTSNESILFVDEVPDESARNE
ncbi:hypothetical protein [Pontibacter sp. G13]|uniref:hypothetical protein n=1 Tax=Pontibacter sp. G13 TaxID=3074898 RepID=UPI002889222B|nr:hypothetical protein [Pontibacter sp. G13]WNJ19648.1 hypothetical protein RJD25_04110 [Pontibacter sp. G13]